MEDSSDTLSDIFKKPNAFGFVQNQSLASESQESQNSKDTSVSSFNDSSNVLTQIFRKPEVCLASSTNSPDEEITPNTPQVFNQPINTDDSVLLKKKKLTLNNKKRANNSNLFADTPSLLSESVVKEPKRRKKCLKHAKEVSFAAQLPVCDSTESSVVLAKKSVAKLSNIPKKNLSKHLSLFDKTESSLLSQQISRVNGCNVSTSHVGESSVIFKKRKRGFTTTRSQSEHLFDSEPNSICESAAHTTRLKRFQTGSLGPQSLLNELSKFSNVSDDADRKLHQKRSTFLTDKENIDINFDCSISTVDDTVAERPQFDKFKKHNNSTVNGSSNIFDHPEGLSDLGENIVSESRVSLEAEEDETISNSINEEEQSRESEEDETLSNSITVDDQSSSSCREPESTTKSVSLSTQESSIDEENNSKPNGENMSANWLSEPNSELICTRSWRKSVSFKETPEIITIRNEPSKLDSEVNESSINKFVLTLDLEMSEQPKSTESLVGEQIDVAKDLDMLSNEEEVFENSEFLRPAIAEVTATMLKSTNEDHSVSVNTETLQALVREESTTCVDENIHSTIIEAPSLCNESSHLQEKTVVEEHIQSAGEIIEHNDIPLSIVGENSNNAEGDIFPVKGDNSQLSNAEEGANDIENVEILAAGESSSVVEHIQDSQTNSFLKNVSNSAEKLEHVGSMNQSVELQPDRICLLEVRKKKRVSPPTPSFFTEDENENMRNQGSFHNDDDGTDAENHQLDVSNSTFVQKSAMDDENIHVEAPSPDDAEAHPEATYIKQIDYEASEKFQNSAVNHSNREPDNCLLKSLLAEETTQEPVPAEKSSIHPHSDINNADMVPKDLSVSETSQRNFSLGSESMDLSAEENVIKNRINDETKVLHSATFVAATSNSYFPSDQNNTYTVNEPVVIKDGIRHSQTLSSIFQRPRVFGLSQSGFDSVALSQDSISLVDAKNQTYTVEKTLIADENSVFLTKKKAVFHQTAAEVEDDVNMFSVNSQLLSETVTLERRVTRSSARLSTLSAELNESVPSQERNSQDTTLQNRSSSRKSKKISLAEEKVDKSQSEVDDVPSVDKSLPQKDELEPAIKLEPDAELKHENNSKIVEKSVFEERSQLSEELETEPKLQSIRESESEAEEEQSVPESEPDVEEEEEKSQSVEESEPEVEEEEEKSQTVEESEAEVEEEEEKSQSVEESEPEVEEEEEKSQSVEESEPEVEEEEEKSQSVEESELEVEEEEEKLQSVEASEPEVEKNESEEESQLMELEEDESHQVEKLQPAESLGIAIDESQPMETPQCDDVLQSADNSRPVFCNDGEEQVAAASLSNVVEVPQSVNLSHPAEVVHSPGEHGLSVASLSYHAVEVQVTSEPHLTGENTSVETPQSIVEDENIESQPEDYDIIDSQVSACEEESEQENHAAKVDQEDESANSSAVFKRPAIHLTRNRSRTISMSLSSSRRKSVSSSQEADSLQFSSQSSQYKTNTMNSSESLVRKMCNEKSSFQSVAKAQPAAKKEKRKPMRLDFDSDDDGKPMTKLPKKPNFPKFHDHCGKVFYNRLIQKLMPKYGIKTNAEAVRLAEFMWLLVKEVQACNDHDEIRALVDKLKRVLCRKEVVITHYDFYHYCMENLPMMFNYKAVPMARLQSPVTFDLTKMFDPILIESAKPE